MARAKTDTRRATAGDRTPQSPAPATLVPAGDIARRAYERYVARARQHGHDMDDWLEAERELQARRAVTDPRDGAAER